MFKKGPREKWKGWNIDIRFLERDSQVNNMFKQAVCTLKSHIFKFNNKVYAQYKGAVIGDSISGDATKLFMVQSETWLNERSAENFHNPNNVFSLNWWDKLINKETRQKYRWSIST